MQTKWFRGKNPAEQAELRSLFNNSEKILDLLSDLCYNSIIELESARINSDYDSPSWAFKQAHLNGKIEALKEVRLLLKSDKDRKII